MKTLFAILILLSAIPIGYILNYFTKEELKQGKKYFKILSITTPTLAIITLFINLNTEYKKTIIFSLLFISVVSFISWRENAF